MILPDKNLLFTKLHRPPVPRDYIPRPRLIERLNAGLDGYLTLVSASAGFGKSTLVSSWIEKISNPENGDHSLPCLWISLDENDNDLTLLLRYLIAAMRLEFPDAGSQTLDLVNGTSSPPPDYIVQTLSNEIDSLPKDFIVVLDDFSALHGQSIHRYIGDMLQHWPDHLHLVLLTRIKPQLPYSKLRSQGNINELYDADLRFTLQETANYLEKTLPFNLGEEYIVRLDDEMEGWIAGLQMATLSLRNSNDPDEFIHDLSGTEMKIYDYLMDEVLSKQPPVIRKFLLKTSILQRFSLDLCHELIRDTDPEINPENSLEWLKRNNLFIIPLDNRQVWYRYHRLFQESLQNRLSKVLSRERIVALQTTASEWYAKNGFLEEAIYQAEKSGDKNLTAKIVEDGLLDVLNRQDRPTMERWLRHFDDDFITTRPGLMMLKFWVAFTNSQIYESAEILHQVEALILSEYPSEPLPEDLRVIRGMVPFLFCQEYYFKNQPLRVIELAEEGLKILPENWAFVRAHIEMYYGLAKQSLGLDDIAVSYFRAEYENLKDKSGVEAECILFGLGSIYFQNNSLHEAATYFQSVVRITAVSHHAINHYWATLYLAQINYYLNNLDQSAQLFGDVAAHEYSALITSFHEASSTLALIHEIQSNPKIAQESLQKLSEFDLENFGAEAPDVQSLRARFWLMQGEEEKAFQWADRFQMAIPDQPLVFIEIPHLTKARILIARNLPGDVEQAMEILRGLKDLAEKTHCKRAFIGILATQALVRDAQGDHDGAQKVLAEALRLNQGSGNIRIFADNGACMAELLLEMEKDGKEIQAIRPILRSLRENQLSKSKTTAVTEVGYTVLTHPELNGSLTRREYDVLVLLRIRMSNKEIGEKLHLSPMTVKRHVTNLLSKLGVHKRWDAVTRSVSLGILPE